MLFLCVLTVLLVAITVFALQNAERAGVRFLCWDLQGPGRVAVRRAPRSRPS
jgi:uncharacterized integral membrane protein